MGIYQYFILGAVLGFAISQYIFASREEKIQKKIIINQRLFSTKKLDKSLEKAVNLMQLQISSLNRELTEEEKDKIIYKCYIENNNNIEQSQDICQRHSPFFMETYLKL